MKRGWLEMTTGARVRRVRPDRTLRQWVRLFLLHLFAALTAPLVPSSTNARSRGLWLPWPDRQDRQPGEGSLLRGGIQASHVTATLTSAVLHSILLIRPDHLGDLLFTTPALKVLRETFPEAHITYLVGPWGVPVMANNPDVDQIAVCPFPGFSRGAKKSFLEPYLLLWKQAKILKERRFDLAILLRFDHWWGALLAYLAGIPARVGYDVAEVRPFLTRAVPYTYGHHEVEQNLRLVGAIGGDRIIYAGQRLSRDDQLPFSRYRLEFNPSAEDREFAAAYLAERGIVSGDPLICIHPGAGAPVKLWRNEAWAQVADTLAQRRGVKIIITGARGEAELAGAIAAQMKLPPIVAAGDTSLGQLAAIMARSRLVLGPDCGPLHLAVAMGVPTVHLYGPVDHQAFGPWGDPSRHRVLLSRLDCIPCNRLDYTAEELDEHPCVRLITVDQVLAVAQELLN
ncbi:MAG: glycosyltransferase family 9 protein [Anaerolineae bacterium]